MARLLGKAEIEDLWLPSRCEKYIRRLQITVDDALRVCSLEGVAEGDSDIQEGGLIERASGETRRQRFTVEQFHS